MYGRCLIPSDNVKQYGKVVKRLKKDKIPFSESFVEEANYRTMTWGLVDQIALGRVSIWGIVWGTEQGPCIEILYGERLHGKTKV